MVTLCGKAALEDPQSGIIAVQVAPIFRNEKMLLKELLNLLVSIGIEDTPFQNLLKYFFLHFFRGELVIVAVLKLSSFLFFFFLLFVATTESPGVK
jgi:hypothetical protein